MLKKFALMAVALTLAVPAFADEPSKSPASKNDVGSTKPAKNPKGHRSQWSDGNEVHAFGQEVKSPNDDSNGKVSGKRHHNPAPPPNGSLDKKVLTGFDTEANAPPK